MFAISSQITSVLSALPHQPENDLYQGRRPGFTPPNPDRHRIRDTRRDAIYPLATWRLWLAAPKRMFR